MEPLAIGTQPGAAKQPTEATGRHSECIGLNKKGEFLMRKMSKKNKIVAVCGAAALTAVGGGVAFAYWTTTGTGTGSGSNAAANGTVVLSATFPDGLTPGGNVPVTYTAANAGSSSLQVRTIHAVVSTSNPACLPADFTIPDVVSNTTVAPGATAAAVGTGTLSFADTAVNQDACKSATITLTLSSN
jgi:hypothetical protein